MGRADELDREGTDRDYVARLDAMQHHIAQDAVLIKLALRQAQREPRSVNRNIEPLQNVRQCAKMIFVSVRKNNCRIFCAILLEALKIRNEDTDTIAPLLGKAHAGVNNDHPATVTKKLKFHPKLADTAEGDDF